MSLSPCGTLVSFSFFESEEAAVFFRHSFFSDCLTSKDRSNSL